MVTPATISGDLMSNHLIVISHRRSGTHLTIDSVWNNISAYKNRPFITMDRLNSAHRQPISLKDFRQELSLGPTIVKTHFLPDFNRYIGDPATCQFLEEMFASSKKIYIFRDGRDVMISLYFYMQAFDQEVSEMTFKSFLNTANNFDPTINTFSRIDFWKFHIERWKQSRFSKETLFLKYEDWINTYEETFRAVARFLDQETHHPVADLRINGRKNIGGIPIQRTSVEPRKGKTGDWKTYFDNQDLEVFRKKTNGFLSMLGYFENDFLAPNSKQTEKEF